MKQKYNLMMIMPILILVCAIAIAHAVDSDVTKQKKQSDYMAQYTGMDAGKTGSEHCILCHGNMMPSKARNHIVLIDRNPKDPNFGFSCEGCHGPGDKHDGDVAGILQPEKMNIDEITESCSDCHSNLRTYRKQSWLISEHYLSDISCLECHAGHSSNRSFLKTETETELCYSCHQRTRAEFRMRSHHPIKEGLMECASCHNSMSGVNEAMLVKEGDHLCYTCHADKQGPFVFDMGLGTDQGGDGCLTCHHAHGSNSESLLRNPRQLCISCHIDMRPPAHFHGDKCWDCHKFIHGSYSDPMFLR